MVKEFLNGQMDENLRVYMRMIKSKDLVSSHGLPDDDIKECGKMGNNKEKQFTKLLKEKLSLEHGSKEKGRIGYQKKNIRL